MSWSQKFGPPQPDGSSGSPEWHAFQDQYLGGSRSDPGPPNGEAVPFSGGIQTDSFGLSSLNSTVPPSKRLRCSYNTPLLMQADSARISIDERSESFHSNLISPSYITSSSPNRTRAIYEARYPPVDFPVPLAPLPMPYDSSHEVSINTDDDLSGRRNASTGLRRSSQRKTNDSLRSFSNPHPRKVPRSRIEKPRLPKPNKRVVHDQISLRFPGRISAGAVSKPYVRSEAREVCDFWIRMNPNRSPEEYDLHSLGRLFQVQVDLLREGFKSTLEDSGYQTAHISEPDITLRYQKKRCKRPKAHLAKGKAPVSTAKDVLKPFACSHRCGARFAKKGAWEKHEQTHYPQRLWVCNKEMCRDTKRVWLRKDRFKDHLINCHEYKKVTNEDYKASYMPISSRYPKTCHFPGCPARFDEWKDRIDHIAGHYKESYDMSTWVELKDESREGEDHIRESATEASDSESSQESHSHDEDEQGKLDDYLGNDNNDDDSDGSDNDHGGSNARSSRHLGRSYDNQSPDGHQSTERRSGQRPQNQDPPDSKNSSRSSGQAHKHSNYRSDSIVRISSRSAQNLDKDIAFSQPSQSSDSTAGTPQFAKPTDTVWVLTNLDLVSVRWLGSGATAKVDEVRHIGSKRTMARKTVHYSHLAENHRIFQEAYIMHRLRHPHVVQLLTNYSDSRTSTILMKPAADYNLSHYLQTRSPTKLASNEALGWFSCLVSGLQHMHEQDIVHGDIKPHNILISEARVYYTDFGLARDFTHNDPTTSNADFVTKKYAAPEAKEGLKGRASDIWSLGCVFLEMLIFMLHHSVEQLSESQTFTMIHKRMDTSYSHNPAAVAASLRSCRSITKRMPRSASVLEVLDCCEAMLDLNAGRRPTVYELAERIMPRFCCTSRLDEFPDHYSWSNIVSKQTSIGQNHEMIDNVQQTLKFSHVYRDDVSRPAKRHVKVTQNDDLRIDDCVFDTSRKFKVLDKQSLMLLRWLREPAFSYEAFCITDRRKTNPYEHLISESKHIESLMEQLSISSTPTTSLKDTFDMPPDGYEEGAETKISLSAQESMGEHNYDTPTDQMSLSSFTSIRPAYTELWVFSTIKKTWIAVQAHLDSGTRVDRVSQKLVDALQIQDELGSIIDTNTSTPGNRIGQQVTVRLQWRWPSLNNTLENWFLVTDEPTDIVIGSDFLFNLGSYGLHHTEPYRTSTIENHHWLHESSDSSQKGGPLDGVNAEIQDQKQLSPISKYSCTLAPFDAGTKDLGSITAFVGVALHVVYSGNKKWYTEDYTLTVRYGSMRIRYSGFHPALRLDCRITTWVTDAEFQSAAFNSSLIDATLGE
ncbi:hypothetical protein MMC18_001499 [Xylographa bjoerkii]|nr:hypothetical protein [Xylographa bjoerkii]